MTDDNYGCLPGPNNFRRILVATQGDDMPFIANEPIDTDDMNDKVLRGLADEERVSPDVDQTRQKPRFPGLGCPDRDWCAGNGCWWDCARPFDIDSEE